MNPLLLPANQPRDRFYAGGAAIAMFRNDPPPPRNTPEDWVASVTTVRGAPDLGLTRLPGGRSLADHVHNDPTSWLGDAHLAAFGADPNLLVKLLDAGQRLPIHAHPDDAFAARHLGTAHGKAEAWYILAPGVVHLGLSRDITESELAAIVRDQRAPSLLAMMHSVRVEPGDTVYVPPGVLHAVGEGVFLVEVQQPEDLSILLEWTGFDLDGVSEGHLGLGFPTALSCVELDARTATDIDKLIRRCPGQGNVLVPAAAPYFRMDRVDVSETPALPVGFAVLVVLDGDLLLRTASGELRAPSGATVVIPAAAGAVELSGSGSALHCRPPAPPATA